ncbi:uncharacterized protein G2W53_017616 [Senna tora]|uniref:Uncharacterized protein n=1 Tax=Senna tora TaxID=362788 RepID=A0A834TS85_9FABA|nr:uncharacterized protein G2W53_017616 [Senna tora]
MAREACEKGISVFSSMSRRNPADLRHLLTLPSASINLVLLLEGEYEWYSGEPDEGSTHQLVDPGKKSVLTAQGRGPFVGFLLHAHRRSLIPLKWSTHVALSSFSFELRAYELEAIECLYQNATTPVKLGMYSEVIPLDMGVGLKRKALKKSNMSKLKKVQKTYANVCLGILLSALKSLKLGDLRASSLLPSVVVGEGGSIHYVPVREHLSSEALHVALAEVEALKREIGKLKFANEALRVEVESLRAQL